MRPSPHQYSRRGAASWTALIVAIVVFVAACGSSESDSETNGDPDGTGSTTAAADTDCIVVNMAVSSEKIALLTELATEFNNSGFEVDGKCVRVTPNRKASGAAMQDLALGWNEAVSGPAPVIWSPASSAWGAVLNQRLSDSGKPLMVESGRPFMLTPLVIAMPKTIAQAIDYPNAPLGWDDVKGIALGDTAWPLPVEFSLGKTNPHFSTSGLSALIAQTYACTGKSTNLSIEDLNAPSTEDCAKAIESAVVHYGDTTLTFLCNLAVADAEGRGLVYASAVAVEEKSVIDYNQGDCDGVPGQGPPERVPSEPLVAIYPSEGTLFSDNPFFILDADWVDEAASQAAGMFQEFVQRPENQEKVIAFGFRPANPSVPLTSPFVAEFGVNPDQPQNVLEVPEPAVVSELIDKWDTWRKGARVLLVLDVSGSMSGQGDPATGEAKLTLARNAAMEALGLFTDEDELGLMLFNDEITLAVPINQLADNRSQISEALQFLTPGGGTALYDATLEAYQMLDETYEEERINAVVVLSDGADANSSASLRQLINALRPAESEPTRIRVFTIAFGSDAELQELKDVSDATEAKAYDATDATNIDKIFDSVISNF